VSRVCATIDCQGPAGKDGTNGTDGVDGQDAPPAPDEQVATMVANYCAANNGCRPTDDEVAEAIEIYCSVGERCRGLKGDPSPPPDSYTRTETTTDPITGVQTTTAFSCTRTSPPEQTAPDYDCQEVPQ
jgi:hypothetical protein